MTFIVGIHWWAKRLFLIFRTAGNIRHESSFWDYIFSIISSCSFSFPNLVSIFISLIIPFLSFLSIAFVSIFSQESINHRRSFCVFDKILIFTLLYFLVFLDLIPCTFSLACMTTSIIFLPADITNIHFDILKHISFIICSCFLIFPFIYTQSHRFLCMEIRYNFSTTSPINDLWSSPMICARVCNWTT